MGANETFTSQSVALANDQSLLYFKLWKLVKHVLVQATDNKLVYIDEVLEDGINW